MFLLYRFYLNKERLLGFCYKSYERSLQRTLEKSRLTKIVKKITYNYGMTVDIFVVYFFDFF